MDFEALNRTLDGRYEIRIDIIRSLLALHVCYSIRSDERQTDLTCSGMHVQMSRTCLVAIWVNVNRYKITGTRLHNEKYIR